jgi:Holliday junction resolvase-like predicted endonuclease
LANPEASEKHGRLGEGHVLKILRERHKPSDGFKVIHVSARTPGADHDIAVTHRNRVVRLVEVKTRVGKVGDPVLISEPEMLCRRAQRGRHSIFVVYLGSNSSVREVVEIGATDDFALRPQQHWLYPGIE